MGSFEGVWGKFHKKIFPFLWLQLFITVNEYTHNGEYFSFWSVWACFVDDIFFKKYFVFLNGNKKWFFTSWRLFDVIGVVVFCWWKLGNDFFCSCCCCSRVELLIFASACLTFREKKNQFFRSFSDQKRFKKKFLSDFKRRRRRHQTPYVRNECGTKHTKNIVNRCCIKV